MDITPVGLPDTSKKGVQEKYIRTFADDMETLKKGGTLGLKPLEETPIAASIADTEPTDMPLSAPLEPAPPAPEPLPPDEGSIQINDEPIIVSESEPDVDLRSPQSLPPPVVRVAPPPLPPPAPIREPVAEPQLSGPTPIHTYSQAFQHRLEKTHASTATVLAAEQDSKKQQAEAPKRSGSKWSVVFSILLLLIGSGGVYVAYSRYLVKIAPVILAPTVQTPIAVDNRVTVSGSGDALLQAFAAVVSTPIPPNTVTAVSLDASTSRMTSVFAQLDFPAPGILLRDVDVANTMAGVVHSQSSQSPFFILSVGSYSTTFSGMLTWEPSMQHDMAQLFPLYPQSVATSSATTSTSVTASTSVVPSVFKDETIQNHDVRVYRDAQGRSVLLYGYWNEHTLIIARDVDAFTEILTRLATAHS